jgi:hypothetical protein
MSIKASRYLDPRGTCMQKKLTRVPKKDVIAKKKVGRNKCATESQRTCPHFEISNNQLEEFFSFL